MLRNYRSFPYRKIFIGVVLAGIALALLVSNKGEGTPGECSPLSCEEARNVLDASRLAILTLGPVLPKTIAPDSANLPCFLQVASGILSLRCLLFVWE